MLLSHSQLVHKVSFLKKKTKKKLLLKVSKIIMTHAYHVHFSWLKNLLLALKNKM